MLLDFGGEILQHPAQNFSTKLDPCLVCSSRDACMPHSEKEGVQGDFKMKSTLTDNIIIILEEND